MSLADSDAYLNVRYLLKNADGILEAGSQVAYDQIVLNEAAMPVFDAEKDMKEIAGSVDFVFSNAIYGCPNLSEIITYNTLMVHDNAILGCSSNLKITVPYNLYEEFSNDESWDGYELQTKLVNVTFDAQGGMASYTGRGRN